ncbi:MAG TPA: HEXXH motif-containing putative peptide modification protein [Pseudonocardiaceae bacterium]
MTVSVPRFTAAPDPAAALELRRELERVLVADLRTFCTVAQRSLPAAARTALLTVDRIDPARRATPFLYAVHQDLRTALRAQDRAAALVQLDHLVLVGQADELHLDTLRIRPFDGFSPVDEVFTRTIAESDEEGSVPPPRAVDAAVARAAVLDTERALARLAEVDPDQAGEVAELVAEIVLADGGPLGITTLRCFGTVQLRRPPRTGSPAVVRDLMAAVTQEAAHLALFAMTHADPLLHDAHEGRHASPVGRAPRTPYGILHATFALARLTRLYARLARAGDPEAAARHAEQRRRFHHGYRTLLRHARPTEAGHDVLRRCADLADGS